MLGQCLIRPILCRRLKFELRQTGLEADFIVQENTAACSNSYVTVLVQVSLANLAEAHQQRPYSEIYTEARLRMQVFISTVCSRLLDTSYAGASLSYGNLGDVPYCA